MGWIKRQLAYGCLLIDLLLGYWLNVVVVLTLQKIMVAAVDCLCFCSASSYKLFWFWLLENHPITSFTATTVRGVASCRYNVITLFVRKWGIHAREDGIIWESNLTCHRVSVAQRLTTSANSRQPAAVTSVQFCLLGDRCWEVEGSLCLLFCDGIFSHRQTSKLGGGLA